MKATGIVRRIDDLGRVVIPKEIRRTMRIREGDPLEIYIGNDAEVIFKKYSPIGEMSTLATQYAEVLSKIGGTPCVICDKDHAIAVSGVPKKELLERRISSELEDMIEQRKHHVRLSGDSTKFIPIEGVDRYALVAYPIISSGDVIGAVLYINSESSIVSNDVQAKLCESAAMFLGKQMEE